jgi:hypothetical protein
VAEAPAPEAPVTPASQVVVEVKPDGSIVQGAPQSQEELIDQMKALQTKFDQLQETVNIVVTQMMSDVEAENAQLRAELKRLQARDQAGLLNSQAVPRPGGEVIDALAEEARNTPAEELERDPLPPAEFSLNVMKEWGREPDAARQLGGNAPTLKGIIGTVPLGSSREEIEQLGRDLRAQYAAYDNINIEIFDDPIAAQQFVDTQTIDPEHRVLSVSKFGRTNRDSVTYFEGGDSYELNTPTGDPGAQTPLPSLLSTATVEPEPEPAPEMPADAPPAPEPIPEAQPAPEQQPEVTPEKKDNPKSLHGKKGRRSGK